MTEQTKPTKAADVLAAISMDTLPDRAYLARALSVGGEVGMVNFLEWAFRQGLWRVFVPAIYVCSEDVVVFDCPLVPREAIVVFHVDGTASVVSVRDGTRGVEHVVAGLAHVGLCSCQLDRGATLKGVRRALAWTAVADPVRANPVIEKLCLDAGVVPLFLPPLDGLVRETLRSHMRSVADCIVEFV